MKGSIALRQNRYTNFTYDMRRMITGSCFSVDGNGQVFIGIL